LNKASAKPTLEKSSETRLLSLSFICLCQNV
jgi:hypothetical protein